MIYSSEVESMTCVAKGPNHGHAPIPQEGRWVQAKEIKDIAGLTHGVGWCAPQQGACPSALVLKTWARGYAVRWEPCMARQLKASAISKWLRGTSRAWPWMTTMR